jgi:hypothetical protein
MKDINHFLNEADAKEKGVKSDADKTKEMKAHHAKELEAINDKMYIALMDQYKQTRRHDRKAAGKLLDKAQNMKDVSARAKLAAAYL